MKGASTFLLRRPRLALLLLLLIVVDGLAGFFTLPRLEDPELPPRAALITTRFVGASAQRVEALVTIPIEEELAELDELKVMRSTSRPGLSTVIIEVRDDLTDFVSAWARVRQALDEAEARLPAEVEKPEFERREARAFALLVGLRWDLESQPNSAILRRLARDLEDRLRSVAGTEKVEAFGLPEEEVQVLLNPTALAAYRLTPGRVVQAISDFDVKTSSGRLRSDQVDLLMQLPELESLQQLASVLVTADELGQTIPLGELATLRRGEVTPPREKVLLHGQRSAVIGAKVMSGQRLDRWAARADRELERFRAELPRGVELEVLFRQSDFTSERLRQLQESLLLGALLVALSVFLTLGWRASLAISAALPLTTLWVLAGMKLLGVPIHQISVTGLIIALGLLIDNAIVVTDEMKRKLEGGQIVEQAVRETVEHLFGPLFSSTLTTVLAFMPLVLMPGPAGEFVGSISITVILALLGSLFLSLTLIPLLFGGIWRLTGTGGPERLRFWDRGVRWAPAGRFLRALLKLCLRRPLLGVALGLLLPVLGYSVAPKLQEQFFPPSDRPQCELTVELNSGRSLISTEALTLEIDALLQDQPEVLRVDWYLGRSTPAFYYNLLGSRQAASNYAQAMVVLDPELGPELYAVQRRIQNLLDAAFPEARVLLRQLEQGPPFEAPVEIRLYGSDLSVLKDLGHQLRRVMSEVPEVTHSQASLDEDLVTLRYQADQVQLRTSGLTATELSGLLAQSTDGAVAGSILEDTEQLLVRVRLADESRQELDRLLSLEAQPSLTVAQLGQLELESEPAVITRRNKKRLNTIQGFVQSGVLPSLALDSFQERLAQADFELPPGYEMSYGGEAAERDQAVGNLLASAGTLGVLMLSTLVLGFSSFRLAALIGAVAFASVGLSLGALWLFGYPFGFMAIVGAIGLVGISINDSIVVLAALEAHPEARQGAVEPMVETVMHCTGHVLTTTLTTIAGFIPLLLNGGSFWPPLAISVAGGVVGATIMALFLVPCVYRLIRRPVKGARRQAVEPD